MDVYFKRKHRPDKKFNPMPWKLFIQVLFQSLKKFIHKQLLAS